MPIPLIPVVDSDAYEQTIPLQRISSMQLGPSPLMRVSDSMPGQGRHSWLLEQAILGVVEEGLQGLFLSLVAQPADMLADFLG